MAMCGSGAPTLGTRTTAARLKMGLVWRGGDEARRVLRGGSWYSYPRDLRAAGRSWNLAEYRVSIAGFRVARTLFTP